MDASRRQETPGLEIKDFNTKSNISTPNIVFYGASPKPQLPQGIAKSLLRLLILQI